MNEPLRWLEDQHTSANLREVLSAAAEAPLMPAALHTQISGYAAGLVSTAVLGKSAAGTWALLGSGAASKALVLVTLMGAAGTGGYLLVGQRLHPTSASEVAIARRPVEQHEQSSAVVTTVVPTATAESAVPASALPNGRQPKERANQLGASSEPSNDVPRAVAAFDEPSIADEARLLENARLALVVSPARALEMANQHQRLHPNGQLSAEREVIAVDALLRLGRRREAEQRAAPQLEQAPDSLYARRLRQLLAPGAP